MNYTKKAEEALFRAKEAAAKLGNSYIGTEHILLGLTLVQDSIAAKSLEAQNVLYHQVMEHLINMQSNHTRMGATIGYTPKAKGILEAAETEAEDMQSELIGTEHILIALIREEDSVAANILRDLDVSRQVVYQGLLQMIGVTESEMQSEKGMRPKEKKEEKSPLETLEKYSRNLTQMAKNQEFDPIVEREPEMERVIQVLSRRMKNNPCLIGDPGVGKTAIVEGLAMKIAEGNIPEILKNKKIFSLDLSSMVAGSKYRGEFEERMKKVLDEVRADGEIILFVDEIHTIIGAGGAEGAIDASSILKPSLARGELQLIGATTIGEYRKHIEKDAAFERRFQPVDVAEPTETAAIVMLQALKEKYELHHKVRITEEAITGAVRLSMRYVADRFLPDKAIDLIDEAASRLRLDTFVPPTQVKKWEAKLEQMELDKEAAIKEESFAKAGKIKKEQVAIAAKLEQAKADWEAEQQTFQHQVTFEDVATVVSRWTGIPLQSLQEEESKRLMELEKVLHKRVIGQDEAIQAVAKAVRRGRVGLKDPNRPIGSFLFLGPTGVGKTELSKALAEALFGNESSMIRIDMSEYMEKHSVSRMVGAPPGYVGYEEGGQLSEKVRRNPYSVILFDEIEKAAPEVFNVLLQVLDDGRITDGQGRIVDFKNTVIIMTSNAGARNIITPKRLGFTSGETAEENYQHMKKLVMEEVKQTFKPEFLNRIDDTIVFHPLTQVEVAEIVGLLAKTLAKRVNENMGITLHFTDKAIAKIAEENYDKAYGARPLRRAIQTKIEDVFAEEFLLGNIGRGDKVSVGVKTGGFTFRKVKK
ncbi:ATP-dependent Clp protease ATP-binding subunit [Chakrabartyella piscis]|uniref:ATP-dependent Clp protease ATP-binding subunit n=1 Tax=Chakrabartyella piscis TaxID=2918914 RepID=UPI002F40CF8B